MIRRGRLGTLRVTTLKKGINDTIMYDEDAVEERYGFPPRFVADWKGLRGDPSDNLPGVPGVGEKTAAKLVNSYGDVDSLYARLDEQTPKLRQALLDNAAILPLARQLVTLDRNAPIDLNLPACPGRPPKDGA